MLDTWSLRVLVAVYDNGSFSGAASALSLTQPAVSRQIAGLERRFGMRLFHRVPRGVRATPAGMLAVEFARETLARLRAMETPIGLSRRAGVGRAAPGRVPERQHVSGA